MRMINRRECVGERPPGFGSAGGHSCNDSGIHVEIQSTFGLRMAHVHNPVPKSWHGELELIPPILHGRHDGAEEREHRAKPWLDFERRDVSGDALIVSEQFRQAYRSVLVIRMKGTKVHCEGRS